MEEGMQRKQTKSREKESPEFEFLTSATTPQISADELFVNGLLLPLSLLHLHPNLHHPPDSKPDSPEPCLKPGSTRWKDLSIFKNKGDKLIKIKKKKNNNNNTTTPDNNTNNAININLWPFSRSRSAGTGSTRPKPISNPTRKSSSAPCSRSNSSGDSKSRKWPVSPGRAGVHLGRASPVWQQARRPKPGNTEARVKKVVPPVARVLNLNVPMCIGGGEGLVSGEGSRFGGNTMFNFRTMFSKKVY